VDWNGAELVVACMMVIRTVSAGWPAQLLEVNLSFAIGRQIGEHRPFFFESLAGVEDGFVSMRW